VSYAYTEVQYFNEDDLEKITDAHKELVDNFEGRRPFISKAAAAAMERRLNVIRDGIDMLIEPVPRSYE
jgi:hypothetical protein